MNIIIQGKIDYQTLDALIAQSVIDYCDLDLVLEPVLLMSNITLKKIEQDMFKKHLGVNFYVQYPLSDQDMTPCYQGMKIAIANWLKEGEVEIR